MGQSQENNTSGNDTFPPLANLQRLAISESGFVFDPVSGHNFTVNETGLFILRLLQKNNRLEPLLDRLTTEYDSPRRELERDVLEFAGLLRDYVGE
ncbi:MAG: PqqD family protein [Gammaproteobacteria bacterium]|nr:PqqD family protein [Gammaproteobacteria bacterium]